MKNVLLCIAIVFGSFALSNSAQACGPTQLVRKVVAVPVNFVANRPVRSLVSKQPVRSLVRGVVSRRPMLLSRMRMRLSCR